MSWAACMTQSGLPPTEEPLHRQKWAKVRFRSKRCGVTLLDAHKMQTFPFYEWMKESSLYRLAPFLLVTKESMTHFLHARCYGDDIQMASPLNRLPVVNEPSQGDLWKEPRTGTRGSSLMVAQVLCVIAGPCLHHMAPGGLSLWSPPATHPFCSL